MSSSTDTFDDIVVGVGGSGSAAVYYLAKRGRKVLGIEQFDIAHELGSSHGLSRIIRKAYHESPDYVALVERAYELWFELERESGQKLLSQTGCLNIGPPDSQVFQGALSAAEEFGIPHEVMNAGELMARYPAIKVPSNMKALLQPEGGFLEPEKCIISFVEGALKVGAEIHARERVISWRVEGENVTVVTDRGRYRSKKLVFTSGSWITKLVPDLPVPLEVERQVVGWFYPKKPELFQSGRLPVWILEPSKNSAYPFNAYGFPSHGFPGFKLGVMHHRREIVDPDNFNREPTREDEKYLRGFMAEYFPEANGSTMALKTCLFTNSPDYSFLLDFHPKHPEVLIVSCCSGHGFKFCSAIGEIVADICSDGKSSQRIDFFSMNRERTRLNADS
jgi:sarcosine oxidase